MKTHLHRIAVAIAVILLGGALFAAPVTAGLQEDITKGYSLIDQWRFEEAEAHTQSLMDTYPDSGDVLFLQARLVFYQGDYARALDLLGKVADSAPTVKEFKHHVRETHQATQGMVTRESEHFILRYTDGPDAVLVDYALDTLEKSYAVLGGILDHHPKEKVRVEIYPSREPFSRISPLTLQDIMTSGTVALCKYNRLMLISPGSLVRGYNWLDTISHEYVHFLLSSKSHNNVPLWLHEGIAKFLETRWRGEPRHLTPIMETVLANGLDNDYLIDFEAMMPSLAKLKTAEDVQLAYAEVATMVQYLVHLKGLEGLEALVAGLKDNRPIGDVLQTLVGKTLDRFQDDWKVYIKTQQLRRIPGLKVLKFQFKDKRDNGRAEDEDGERALIESRRARDLTMLGDILKSRDHIQAAIIEYRKAISESDTLSPVLYNKLADTYMITRKYDESETLLRQSLEYYPQFPSTLTNLGEVAFLRKDYEAAREYYQRAERINPFNPQVHQRLIRIYAALGENAKKGHQETLLALIK
ncbi:tetratricopeptide repeat protein [Nitrospina watsonii]|uniref:TPR_REGION domain-containing protein n=1 Tax=Nitrospina watsonii TaxID=1323948 RepID=A0ABN8W1D8_9BACT|nr:tetratricopeptide repeat protein [Nitrospina watsonii]CAI2718046.1 TPR_REGION domain-containing protein [Nitrospina watsonii]